tara:strand:- start:608 stop:1777 length:1170 start_codon:yes stop_codon:yes gene_type:complete
MAVTKVSNIGVDASLVQWQSVKTSNFTAKAFEGYWVDTSSGAITATLPSSPSAGDMVVFGDYAENFNTNKLNVALNSSKLKGATLDGQITTQGITVALVYADATKGWLVSSSGLASEILQPTFISATGGTITTSGNFKFHAFLSSSTFTVSSLGNSAGGGSTIEYLAVGGGGSGGTGSYGYGAQSNGGGGGAAGLYNNTSFTVSAQAYTITIGAGGAGVAPQNNAGNDGNVSSAFGVNAGAGNANSGMSGGGSGQPQAKAGGGSSTYAGGGGGGAGGVGSAPSGNVRGDGGVGLQFSNFSQFGAEAQTDTITTTPTANGFFAGGGQGGGSGGSNKRAAGGGGAATQIAVSDTTMAGVINTGGGGAGGYAEVARSGNGGSGIVLVRYQFQ